MNKIEHIGIAVKDLNVSVNLYENLLGVPLVENFKRKVSFPLTFGFII